MSIGANKAIVRRYVELWSTGNYALADEVLAANFVDHTHPNQAPGPESAKQEVKAFREGFPDARITIEQMIGESDIVAFRFVLRGTHLGTFAGFPPTGKEAVLTGEDFVRIASGKTVELWSIQETLSWAQRLGFKISRDMTDENLHTITISRRKERDNSVASIKWERLFVLKRWAHYCRSIPSFLNSKFNKLIMFITSHRASASVSL